VPARSEAALDSPRTMRTRHGDYWNFIPYVAYVYGLIHLLSAAFLGMIACAVGALVCLVIAALRGTIPGAVSSTSFVSHFSVLEWLGVAVALGTGAAVCLGLFLLMDGIIGPHTIQMGEDFAATGYYRPLNSKCTGFMCTRVPCLVKCRTVTFWVSGAVVRAGIALAVASALGTVAMASCSPTTEWCEAPARYLGFITCILLLVSGLAWTSNRFVLRGSERDVGQAYLSHAL